MRNHRHFVLLFVMMLAPSAGCVTAPVLDLYREVPDAEGAGEIADAIMVALTIKGWTVAEYVPGAIGARIMVGSHYARIELAYDERSYSIRHVETSPSLRYNGEKVHKRYNRWVKALDDVIMRNLYEARAHAP